MSGTASAVARSIHEDVEEILLSGEQIASRVVELGVELAADYVGRTPVLVSVHHRPFSGPLPFMAATSARKSRRPYLTISARKSLA